jgi:acylglycerol lipase
MWAPPAASPAAAAGANPSLRRRPSRAAAVRVLVAPPVAARTQQDQPRRRLFLAVPPPASEMASAAADGEEEEGEVVVVERETGRTEAVEMDAALRRELAIRRLREEAEADASEAGTGAGRSRRDFAVFETARGDALFTQSWTPAAADRVKYSHLPTPPLTPRICSCSCNGRDCVNTRPCCYSWDVMRWSGWL